jgi:hypothetical protein
VLAGNGEVDEDTIDELDRVPAAGSVVITPGQAEQPEPDRGRALRNRLLAFALIVIALAVIAIVVLTIIGR